MENHETVQSTGRKSIKSVDSHSTCSTAGQQQRKRSFPRFSLRRLLYSSPLMTRRVTKNYSRHKPNGPLNRDVEKGEPPSSGTEVRRTGSKMSVGPTPASSKQSDSRTIECPLCLIELPREYFPEISTCSHQSCYDCLQQYLRIEISESRVCVSCPECSESMHPNDIRMILNDRVQFEKYEEYMVRRVLAVDPDTRWCPAPDCGFAVIAAECASCPKLKCERPGCDSYFCYHCKAEWHPNLTCNAARAQRSPNNVRSNSGSFSQDSQHNDIKPCPRCQVLIGKMDDGSCNHMTCAVCGAEFCWLCMKEVSDLHYLSPSGCTFWGKKPWSRKKKILWQLGTLIGAPVGIGLIAGIAIPAMIIGIPVWVGRKLYSRYEHDNKHKHNLIIAAGVTASVLVSPVLAGLAVGIGVPILLFYVYGVVPVSLCRSGGCGVSTSATGVRFDFDDENEMSVRNTDAASIDVVSTSHLSGAAANPSIGEASLSLGSGSHLERLDRESASNVALVGASLAGSIASSGVTQHHRMEIQADIQQRFSVCSESSSAVTNLSDGASVRALAGSVVSWKGDSSSISSFRNTDQYPASSIKIFDNPLSADNTSDDALSCLEELTSGLLRRVAGIRKRQDNQASENSSCEDMTSERVRFDEHVSFIDDTWGKNAGDAAEVKVDVATSSDEALGTKRLAAK